MQKNLSFATFILLIFVAISVYLIVVASRQYPGPVLDGYDYTVKHVGIGFLFLGGIGAVVIIGRLAHALLRLYHGDHHS